MRLEAIRKSFLAVALLSAGLFGCETPPGTNDGGDGGGSASGGGSAGGGSAGGGSAGGGSAGGGSAGGGSAGGGSAGGGSAGGGSAGGGSATDGGIDAGPADLDVVVARFTAAGVIDTTFGDGGVARVDLGTFSGTTGTRDSLWGIDKDSTDRIVIFGSGKHATRADVDRAVVRLTANGAIDTTFATATNNIAWLDTNNLGDNARHGIVQPDGKIVSSGYTSVPTGIGTQSANRIVLLRLNVDGTRDVSFNDGGVAAHPVFTTTDGGAWGMAEAYGAVLQSGKYVTGGYGREASTGTVDQVGFRYTSDGQLDGTWGIAGRFILDLAGADDRVRHVVALANDRIAYFGSGSPTSGQIDGLVSILTANGTLDTSYNTTGYKLFSFGRPDEAFFGGAVSPNGMQLAAVGHAVMSGDDDDSTLALIPLATGAPAEYSGIVATSATEHDRFVSVAYDANGKIVAAGWVNEGGDSRLVVARFNADGSRDTTFGTGGIAKHNVIIGKADEVGRSVVIQADGKIVVGGVAER